jgi:hypothetical protein
MPNLNGYGDDTHVGSILRRDLGTESGDCDEA